MTLDDGFIEQVEASVGMGCGAWDMVDPKELCAAVLSVAKLNGLADIDELVRASKVLEKALLLSEIEGWPLDWMATSMTDFRKAVKRMEHYK